MSQIMSVSIRFARSFLIECLDYSQLGAHHFIRQEGYCKLSESDCVDFKELIKFHGGIQQEAFV